MIVVQSLLGGDYAQVADSVEGVEECRARASSEGVHGCASYGW